MNPVITNPVPLAAAHQGPIDWRRLVEWARDDGLITPEEAQRTVARCAQAESVQHPLVRLASVSMRRASDGKALDNGTVRTPKVKVGDKVIYGQYAGSAYKHEGVEYKIVKEDDILAILG